MIFADKRPNTLAVDCALYSCVQYQVTVSPPSTAAVSNTRWVFAHEDPMARPNVTIGCNDYGDNVALNGTLAL